MHRYIIYKYIYVNLASKTESQPDEEEATPIPIPQEQLEKREKPTVKPRSQQSKQITSLISEDEVLKQDDSISPPNASPTVLRRNKSGGSRRSRAATSKYRSGLVIENQMSMEEMEQEIEKEMMNNAATKIQAQFRGFKTRKQITSVYGGEVSKKGTTKGTGGSEAESVEADAASAAISVDALNAATTQCIEDLGAAAAPAAESIASRGTICSKPPLGAIRSFSFPSTHELPSHQDESEQVLIPAVAVSAQHLMGFDEGDEDRLIFCQQQKQRLHHHHLHHQSDEPEVDLELDPDYVNRAATRIQANFRGYQVRKSFKRPSSGKENNSGSKSSAKKLARAHHARQEIQELERERARAMERLQENNNNNEDPPAQPDRAAAKIQASFRGYKERQKFHQHKKAAITIQANIRGYLTRKRLANLRRRSFQRRRSSAKAFQKELDDMRKVNEAATKIQAVFRGYQVRSKMPRSNSMIDEQEQMIDE